MSIGKLFFCSAGMLLLWLHTSAASDGDLLVDTLQASQDTLKPAPPDTLKADTLSSAQKAYRDFLERQKQLPKQEQESQEEIAPTFNYLDTLRAYFLSPRLDRHFQIERSYFRDAGDYFKHNPSFFVIDYQRTPLRKTVQPFGLSGDRLNVITGGLNFAPFEHMIEPDGLMDMNDVPTALDGNVYLLPGPYGQIFGGEKSVATLLSYPAVSETYDAQSSLVVDKGSFSYNYVRGRYSKRFSGGKEIDLSLGYRNADGDAFNLLDDGYHYTVNSNLPLHSRYALKAKAQWYSRQAPVTVQPDLGGAVFRRDRVDRSAEVSVETHNEYYTRNTALGYRYLKQNSVVTGSYSGRFYYNGSGAFWKTEWLAGKSLLRTEIVGDYLKFFEGYREYERYAGDASLVFARLSSGWRFALSGGGKYVEDFKFLPRGSALLFREGKAGMLALSLGYSERAPSLYELYLPFRRSTVYGGTTANYADEGNSGLASEKQMTASLLLEMGSTENNVRATVTGGRILDGINWVNSVENPATDTYRLFRPENGDIEFTDFNLETNVALSDFLNWHTGGAYHIVEFTKTENQPYLPDYQAFSGLELHLFWPQKALDLFAYGEIAYAAEYHGYDQQQLGQEPIVNAKLSFRLKDFRFHYVFQNVLSTLYQERDYSTKFGRSSFWGFVWNFQN